ncbi:DUF2634 domain-containing protein [Cetobacterium sp. 2A]|uniref:DUF2634 domain-containing protein n=1 Tax=Cetobacterium sp. 2A TaxID=2754723 RepID=UPI00163C660F|nr:DUF2634 domain-containing protein [Cetobacterium sp. 2A]MBC2855243.1 DUF2634 domain-containing protein [Cetobacterium sp. 2A]MBC2855291.1 DUF2634 domain-containing protein [Cetobacterium sp. 2A]MBC2855623.1 DUF2634 domain-containing protein [Cetobacterium sp. 2A]
MSIFPSFNESLDLKEENKNKGKKEILFDFKTKKIVIVDGKTKEASEIEQVRQWIELLILTQTGKYRVYDDTGFGMTDLYNLRGHSIFSTPFGVMELEREIKEKIQAKKEVKEVIDIKSTNGFNSLNIEVTVILKSGETLTSEVSI